MTKKHLYPALALCLCFAAPMAHAACVAEYKAKRDNPLELFFEEAKISGACTIEQAEAELRKKLKKQGLTLLKVVSVKEQ